MGQGYGWDGEKMREREKERAVTWANMGQAR